MKVSDPSRPCSEAVSFLGNLPPIAHIAHRGGALLYPENTLLAFQSAVERHGTDIIETDVRLSADGEVVVFHDADLERTTDGTGPVSEWSWAELQGLDAGYRFTSDGGESHPFRGTGVRIPGLEAVLESLPGTRFNIELKGDDPALALAVRDIIRDCGAEKRICIGREDDAAAEHLHELLPDVLHFFPRIALTNWVMGVLMGSPVKPDPRYTMLELPLTFGGVELITTALIAQARSDGLGTFVWTIDELADMEKLVALGVSGIMTDRPDRLREVLSLN